MIAKKTIRKTLLALLLFIPFFGILSAQEHQEETSKETKEKEDFNIAEMILHHIGDSHNFHILDWKGHPVSIPLPVILWTDNGLVTFMSSEFHHDEEGKVVVEKKGQKFALFHGKIYYANDTPNEDGIYVTLDKESHPANKKVLNFSITRNVFSMFLSMIVLILLFGAMAKSYKKSEKNLPSGIAKFIEPIIIFVRDEIAIPNIGEKHYARYMPFLLTIFFFIWLNNIFGIIPFFPFGSNLSGNIAFTGALALITFIITLFSSKKSYWSHMLWMPGVPVYMKIFLAPIELMGMFIKPIALMIRLFANITAGHVIVLALVGLIFILGTAWVSPASVLFTAFISIIEVLVIAIQAYIFTMLSALYFGQALEEEH
ncbi:MAG TPA: ATP synthase F0 subunit A [Flavobacteriia bacterium]|jgi:F-type H+-transporting ATPase subunit a|nr:ATP synthase F0 subunit A [Flavobacteriia bacterium]